MLKVKLNEKFKKYNFYHQTLDSLNVNKNGINKFLIDH